MTAQTEFLWRLAIEVQKLDDTAAATPPGSRERVLAEQMRELYGQIEQLPAGHSLFRRCRAAPGLAPILPVASLLSIVKSITRE